MIVYGYCFTNVDIINVLQLSKRKQAVYLEPSHLRAVRQALPACY